MLSQAVEPVMKTDEDKGLAAFAPVGIVAGLALVAIPLLPILFAANPDQALKLVDVISHPLFSQ